jgi:hypothetical protein
MPGNEPERPYPRRFSIQLEICSNRGSDQHRGTKATNYVGPIKHEVNLLQSKLLYLTLLFLQ